MVIRIPRPKRGHRSADQRGAMTLVELLVAGVIGLAVLAMAGEMLSVMSSATLSTQSKVDAEVKARQSLDDVMRYMRAGAPLGGCSRWSASTATINKMAASDMGKCLSFSYAPTPLTEASPTQLEMYAYTAQTGEQAGYAPDKVRYTLSQTTETRDGVSQAVAYLTVSVSEAASGASMQRAYCAAYNNTTGDCAGATSPWPANPTATYRFEVAPDTTLGSPQFTYLDSGGNAGSTLTASTVRLVMIDLGVQYKGPNRTPATFAYRADVAIRTGAYRAQETGS